MSKSKVGMPPETGKSDCQSTRKVDLPTLHCHRQSITLYNVNLPRLPKQDLLVFVADPLSCLGISSFLFWCVWCGGSEIRLIGRCRGVVARGEFSFLCLCMFHWIFFYETIFLFGLLTSLVDRLGSWHCSMERSYRSPRWLVLRTSNKRSKERIYSTSWSK